MKKNSISIVIPALNEEKYIAGTIKDTVEVLRSIKDLDYEIIVVASSEHSVSKTAKIAEKVANDKTRIITPDNIVGKGRDIKIGVLNSTKEFVLFMDADLATPPRHITKILQDIASCNYDIQIGVRNLDQIHDEKLRAFSSKVLNIVAQKVIGANVSDTQCGFKIFKTDAAKVLFEELKTSGWAFDIEILKLANRKGMRIAEYKIEDWSDPKPQGEGLSGENFLFAMAKSVVEIIKIAFI